MEDQKREKRKPNPRESANIFSTLTFLYTLPLFFYGRRNIVTEDDVFETYSKHKSSVLAKKARELWKLEIENFKKKQTAPSLKNVIVKLNRWRYLFIVFIFVVLEIIIRPMQTLLLGKLISCYSVPERKKNMYMYAIGLIISPFLSMAIIHPSLYQLYQIAINMRIICSSLIYDKILRLNKTAIRQSTSGQIINMLSNDIGLFDKFPFTALFIAVGPMQALVFTYFMYKEIGISAIYGILLLSATTSLSFSLKKITKIYRTKASVRRDERLRLMNEIIQGIKVIKMYAWEKPFGNIVAKCRNLEVGAISTLVGVKAVHFFYPVFTTMTLYVMFIPSILQAITITAESAFVITSFITHLNLIMIFLIPSGVAQLGEVGVAIKRINNFLLSDEIQLENLRVDEDYAIRIIKASVKRHLTDVLLDVNVRIKKESFSTIIGPVGSGKSSLLHVILQELPLTSGELRVNGVLSYASQEPWIFSASIRQNILFGSKMNKERYQKVIKCCALDRDLTLLSYGDRTTVGEKGDSLSGGQKARINLARAVYKEADIYLLDDPLSAVDSRVGKQIFEECIRDFLKNKTVVLVTHQVQYVKHADNILALEGGSVKIEGSASELEKSGFEMVKYLSESIIDCSEDVKNLKEVIETPNKVTQQEIQHEHSASGSISLSIYKDYFLKSKSYLHLFLLAVFFITTQLLYSASFYIIAIWVNQDQKATHLGQELFIYTYTFITVASFLLTALLLITFVKFIKNVSESFHDAMFNSVVHSTLNFFNLNSSGRILNRFSKDLGNMDEQLSLAIFVTIRTFLIVFGIFGVVITVHFHLVIPTIVLLIILYFIRRFYLGTSLNILRTESVVRSYLYGHVNTSLQGLSTIRAFGVQDILTEEYYYHQDTHSTASDMFFSTARAFGYWMDGLCSIYIAIITLYFVLGNEKYGGNVGLVITQTLALMNILSICVRQLTDVENYMISTERVLEYSSLEQEEEINKLDIKSIQKPPLSWPNKGEIKFVNLSLKYPNTNAYVLDNLNFTVQPNEKIGIVGRTGAGKSSIVSSVFQLYKTDGSIIIDEINVRDITLHDLRKKISIIPQDPILFTGTVRQNLDPFEEFSDDVIWMALEEVRLKAAIEKMDLGLSSELSQNSANLSVGQRQLICLARAIIRSNKILVLDEATAKVDLQTDEIIQDTIKEKFLNCTVLTVAHRLNTIIESDRVLVMDAGKLIELDHPYVLLQNKGLFYNLVYQNEDSVSKFLVETAKNSYEKKKNN